MFYMIISQINAQKIQSFKLIAHLFLLIMNETKWRKQRAI